MMKKHNRYLAKLCEIGLVLTGVIFLSGCPLLIAPAMVYDETVSEMCDSCMGDVGRYRVDSAKFPEYKINQSFQPANRYLMGVELANHLKFTSKVIEAKMPEIDAGDIWRVKYDLGDQLIIQSASYLKRYKALNADTKFEMWTQSASELGIVIKPNGAIVSNLITTKFKTWGYMTDREQRILNFDTVEYQNNWPEDISFTQ